MEAVAIVTILALLQYIFFGMHVGSIRGRTGVIAPAMTGNDEFERMNLVHQNTQEQLVVLIPVLWLYAHFVNPLWGAGMTLVYLLGRFVYLAAYLKDPRSRSLGFTMSILPVLVMAVWVLVLMVMQI